MNLKGRCTPAAIKNNAHPLGYKREVNCRVYSFLMCRTLVLDLNFTAPCCMETESRPSPTIALGRVHEI